MPENPSCSEHGGIFLNLDWLCDKINGRMSHGSEATPRPIWRPLAVIDGTCSPRLSRDADVAPCPHGPLDIMEILCKSAAKVQKAIMSGSFISLRTIHGTQSVMIQKIPLETPLDRVDNRGSYSY